MSAGEHVVLFVAVCAAGGLGAVARFVVDGEVKRRRSSTFPWATFVINVSGSLILGLLTGILIATSGPASLKAVIGTGFCGGYTTFSTAVVETIRLLQRGEKGLALVNAAGTWVATLIASGVGLAVGMLAG